MSRVGVFGTVLHESSFGGLRIDVLLTQEDESRALARFKYPHVNGQALDDMGGEGRTTDAKVVFMPLAGDESADRFLQRFNLFRQLKESGETRTFVHPLDGPFQAKIGKFTWVLNPDQWDAITVDCTFEEDTDVATSYQAGPGSSLLSAVAEVEASGAAFDAAVDADPTVIKSTVSADCNETVSAWAQAGRTARQINLELVRLSNRISQLTDDYELATNVRRYPIMVSLVRLNSNLRLAAESFKQSTPRLIDITVLAPMPLLVVAAKRYGARDASKRATEMLSLNDIKNPARIEAGTTLKGQAPQLPAGQRRVA